MSLTPSVPSLTSVSTRLFSSCSNATNRYYPTLASVATAAIFGYCTTGGFSSNITITMTKSGELTDQESIDLITGYFRYLGYGNPTVTIPAPFQDIVIQFELI